MNKNDIKDSKVFCMAPWVHVHAWSGGEVYPCCLSNVEKEHQFGNLNDTPLGDILNTDKAKQLRKNMLNGERSKACTRCYEQEEYGFKSLRQSMNKENGHHYDLVENTSEDGTLNELRITYWDIRFSNNCNMKCRSCGPDFSTMWFDDSVKLLGDTFAIHNQKVKKVRSNFDSLMDETRPQIKNLERIYFAGGEPLIMPEHWTFIDEVIAQGNLNAHIFYQTNLSQLTYKKRSAIDIWNKLERVKIMASIDAYGPRAEYVRAGQPWDKIEENIRLIRRECPNVEIFDSCTVGIMNIDHVVDLHKYLYENELIDINKFGLNPLFHPEYYRVEIAPPEVMNNAKKKLDDHINYLQTQNNDVSYTLPQFISYRKMLDNPSMHEEWWPQYSKITRKLDTIRNQRVEDYLPELASYVHD